MEKSGVLLWNSEQGMMIIYVIGFIAKDRKGRE